MYLGPTGNIQSFNEDPDTFPYPGQVGQVYRTNDKWYQMVKIHTSCLPVPTAGQMAYWLSQPSAIVTTSPNLSVAADKDQGLNFAAGVIVGAPSRGYLGFIQKGGPSLVPVFSTTIGRPGDLAVCQSVGIRNVTAGAWAASSVPSADPMLSGLLRVGVYRTSTEAISAMAYVELALRHYEL